MKAAKILFYIGIYMTLICHYEVLGNDLMALNSIKKNLDELQAPSAEQNNELQKQFVETRSESFNLFTDFLKTCEDSYLVNKSLSDFSRCNVSLDKLLQFTTEEFSKQPEQRFCLIEYFFMKEYCSGEANFDKKPQSQIFGEINDLEKAEKDIGVFCTSLTKFILPWNCENSIFGDKKESCKKINENVMFIKSNSEFCQKVCLLNDSHIFPLCKHARFLPTTWNEKKVQVKQIALQKQLTNEESNPILEKSNITASNVTQKVNGTLNVDSNSTKNASQLTTNLVKNISESTRKADLSEGTTTVIPSKIALNDKNNTAINNFTNIVENNQKETQELNRPKQNPLKEEENRPEQNLPKEEQTKPEQNQPKEIESQTEKIQPSEEQKQLNIEPNKPQIEENVNKGKKQEESQPPVESPKVINEVEEKPIMKTKPSEPATQAPIRKKPVTIYEDPRKKLDPTTQTNYMSYLVFLFIIGIVVYMVLHNKNKLIALVLEGRRGRGGRRSRSSSAQYRKLDNNLEEAMLDDSSNSLRQVIY